MRKSVRQNSVQIYTASTFSESHAKLITVDHQTKIVSIFRRTTELGFQTYGVPKSHQEDTYGLTKNAKHRQDFTLTRRKWWLEKMRPLIKNKKKQNKTEMIRRVMALGRIICCRPNRKKRSPCIALELSRVDRNLIETPTRLRLQTKIRTTRCGLMMMQEKQLGNGPRH